MLCKDVGSDSTCPFHGHFDMDSVPDPLLVLHKIIKCQTDKEDGRYNFICHYNT